MTITTRNGRAFLRPLALASLVALLAVLVGLQSGPAGFGPEPQSAEAALLTEVKKLLASDAQDFDQFGWSVAVSGDTAVVGAREEDNAGGSNAGAAYVFQRDQGGAGNWGEVKKLTASDAQAHDGFANTLPPLVGPATHSAAILDFAPFHATDESIDGEENSDGFLVRYTFQTTAAGPAVLDLTLGTNSGLVLDDGGEMPITAVQDGKVAVDSPGGCAGVPPPPPSCSISGPLSGEAIDDYLRCKDSPMVGEGEPSVGEHYMKWGRYFGIDPRAVVAISGAESSFGKNPCGNAYNVWGWMPGGEAAGCWTGFEPGWDEDGDRPEFADAPGYEPGKGVYMDTGYEDGIFWLSRQMHLYIERDSLLTVEELADGIAPEYCVTGRRWRWTAAATRWSAMRTRPSRSTTT